MTHTFKEKFLDAFIGSLVWAFDKGLVYLVKTYLTCVMWPEGFKDLSKINFPHTMQLSTPSSTKSTQSDCEALIKNTRNFSRFVSLHDENLDNLSLLNFLNGTLETSK